MSKEICISTTPHETRLAILENDELTEIYYERENEYTLAGSIYKGRVTRVLPGMQSAFVDVGLERDAFLYVTDFLEEQEDGEDFESANGGASRQGRDGGREGGQAREARPRQPQSEPQAEIRTEPVGDGTADDSDSPSGTRRWRGRRGRKRGFRPRGQQDESRQVEPGSEDAGTPRSVQVVDVPLEAEPEATREYRTPSAPPAQTQSSGQRILLPGESLSKYGATSGALGETRQSEVAAQPAQFKTNYTAPKPSTLIETPIQWDGGALMPGESLSRYRGPEKAETHAVEPAESPAMESPETHASESYTPAASATAVAEEHRAVAEVPAESVAHVSEPVHELPTAEI